MSDRCFMRVTCRRADRARFEALGFAPEFTDAPTEGAVIELVDAGADYGHHGRLPTDIPFVASHDAGGNFGPRRLACDGRVLAEIPATQEGFVIQWDARRRQPSAMCLRRLRRFMAVQLRAQRRLAFPNSSGE
jgi:hypothetical protein